MPEQSNNVANAAGQNAPVSIEHIRICSCDKKN